MTTHFNMAFKSAPISECAAHAVPVHLFLSRLEGVRKTPEGWRALCPSHHDRRPSLSIGEGLDGRVLLHCFAGCRISSIVWALGLKVSDLFRPVPP